MRALRESTGGTTLLKNLSDVGLQYIDRGQQNFGLNMEGDIVYVDEFVPWKVYNRDTEIIKFYNPESLRSAIEDRCDNQVQVKALKYLDRLEDLSQQEEKYIKK